MCELFLLLKTFIPLFSNWHYLSKTYFDYFWEGKHKFLKSVFGVVKEALIKVVCLEARKKQV